MHFHIILSRHRAGGSLQEDIDRLPVIGLDDTVLDIDDHTYAQVHEPELLDGTEESEAGDLSSFPGHLQVVSEGDLFIEFLTSLLFIY